MKMMRCEFVDDMGTEPVACVNDATCVVSIEPAGIAFSRKRAACERHRRMTDRIQSRFFPKSRLVETSLDDYTPSHEEPTA